MFMRTSTISAALAVVNTWTISTLCIPRHPLEMLYKTSTRYEGRSVDSEERLVISRYSTWKSRFRLRHRKGRPTILPGLRKLFNLVSMVWITNARKVVVVEVNGS